MVAGQVQDILSTNLEPDHETLEFIHIHKTAELIRASVMMGPILYGSNKDISDALSEYGNNIGLAFQVIDDILDIEGDAEELGKPIGSDERANKMTYPSLYGIEKSRDIAKELIASAVSSLSSFSYKADPLRKIANYLLDRRS
jgi:geranylgeranyl diphosphate synthase type II